jgi:hypothetical protein
MMKEELIKKIEAMSVEEKLRFAMADDSTYDDFLDSDEAQYLFEDAVKFYSEILSQVEKFMKDLLNKQYGLSDSREEIYSLIQFISFYNLDYDKIMTKISDKITQNHAFGIKFRCYTKALLKKYNENPLYQGTVKP